MKIQYLGTAAAEGVPALFCNCAYCRALRGRIARGEGGREVRSRAQILLDGELSIEFPPDSFYHMARFGVDLSAVRYALITHSHMDHLCAHDLVLRGYKYAHEMTAPHLTLFGNREVLDVVEECTRREMKGEVANNLTLRAVGAFEEIAFDDWKAYTMPARHSSREPLLYLIERGGKRVLHLTDTGLLPEESFAFLGALNRRVDVVTLDCTFLFEEASAAARHMGIAENIAVRSRLLSMGVADERTKFVITHFSHNSAPSDEAVRRAEREYGFIAAYDGMLLEI